MKKIMLVLVLALASCGLQPAYASKIHVSKGEVDLRIENDGLVYVNDHLAAIESDDADVIAYQSGVYTVYVYKHTTDIWVMRGDNVWRLK